MNGFDFDNLVVSFETYNSIQQEANRFFTQKKRSVFDRCQEPTLILTFQSITNVSPVVVCDDGAVSASSGDTPEESYQRLP